MQKKLRTAPFTMDAGAIARGLLDLFDENEKIALRFGMLPAQKMEIVQKMMREKFLENATSKEGDLFTVIYDDGTRRQIVEFSMKKLVSEAVHEISLALYGIGDLVV